MSVRIDTPVKGAELYWQNGVQVEWTVSGYEATEAAVGIIGGNQPIPANGGYSATGSEYTFSDTKCYYAYLDGKQPDGRSYVRIYVRPVKSDGQWPGETAVVQFWLKSAPRPEPVRITQPARGTTHYINSDLSVQWAFTGELPQGRAEISISVDKSGTPWEQVGEVKGDGASFVIPASVLAKKASSTAQTTALWVRVDGYDTAGRYAESASVLIYLHNTIPGKPIPTAPGDGDSTYPSMPTVFTAPYQAHGGAALLATQIQWRKDIEAVWAHSRNFSGDATSHTLPAGTFGLGTWHWRLRHRNALGEWGPWSDSRTLYSVASAPLRPAITQPENGETIYNDAPVGFAWSYIGALQQAGWKLQYDIGGTGWVTLSGRGEAGSHSVDLAGKAGVVSWRVQTANAAGEVSPWSATGIFTLKSSAPEITPTYPTGGFIDRLESQTFTWDYHSPVDKPQGGYRLSWKVQGDQSWRHVDVTSALPQHTFPAGHFPDAQTIHWSIQVWDAAQVSDGMASGGSFTTRDVAPDAPVPLEPIGLYISTREDVIFRWRHASPLGTPQGKAEVRWRLDAGGWQTLSVGAGGEPGDGGPGAAQQATAPAGTFSAGTVSWQVRTANRAGEWGPYSPAVSFGVAGAPPAPTITQVYGTARPGIDWLAAGQVVYEIIFLRDGREIYRDMRLSAGDTGSYRIPRYLTPGTVTVRLRVKNQFDAWSPWSEAQCLVAADDLTPPSIGAYADGGAGVIRLSVEGVDWALATRVVLYRDGTPIALLDDARYVDAACSAGRHVYQLIAEYAGVRIARSADAEAVLTLPCIALAPARDPERILWIRRGHDAPPGRSAGLTPEGALLSVAGRALPMAFYGPHVQRAYAISCAADRQQAQTISAMADGPVRYRDPDGRADLCRISEVQTQAIPYAPGMVQASISLDAVDEPDVEIF